MANRSVNLSAFPKLRFSSGDVSGLFRSWLTQFNIAVEVTTFNLGVDADNVNVFRGRPKLLALLSAIGSDGVETLQSLGFDVASNADDAFDQALGLLQTYYEREESVYVRTMKFVTVSQACDEDEREYLLRVERLSRTMGFGAQNDELRQQFAVALAVNGLKGSDVRKEMMEQANLDSATLTARLRARRVARESEFIVSEARSSQSGVWRGIKTEVSNVDIANSDSSDSDYSRSGNRGARSSGRSRHQFDSERGRKRYESSRCDVNYRSRNISRLKDKGISNWSGYRSSGSSESSDDRADRFRRVDSIRKSPSQRFHRDSPPNSHHSFGQCISPMRHDRRCFECYSRGHRVRNCPYVYCFTCKKKGHTSIDCPNGCSGRHSDSDECHKRCKSPIRNVRFVESWS